MSLRKSIKKTKKLFLKTLQNLKKLSLVSHDYHNIPKTIFLNPISCTTIKQTTPISTHSITNHGRDTFENPIKNIVKTGLVYNAAAGDNFKNDIIKPALKPSPVYNATKDDIKNAKIKQALRNTKTEPKSTNSSCRFASDGPYILAQKMKELDMIEVEEVDHVLDVEEALNYYSRLSCPVYVEIVDKFFLDMYDEFLLPPPSINLNSSSRRLGPLKL